MIRRATPEQWRLPGVHPKALLATLLVAAFVLSLSPSPARTQEVPEPEPPEHSYEQNEPPYEAPFLRLSEILGAVHYLRRLCDSDEGSLWRDQMQALIDSEVPNPIRRARIIDRFNRGFESFRSVYRTCTPAAALAIDRYMDEGIKVARDITARYGK
jgi:uncharacterized protein (TIGR02301 family)